MESHLLELKHHLYPGGTAWFRVDFQNVSWRILFEKAGLLAKERWSGMNLGTRHYFPESAAVVELTAKAA